MILRFKAFSAKNRDFNFVSSQGRLRGCLKGDPMLVYGHNIYDSEMNLDIVRHAFQDCPKATLVDNTRGSFTIVIGEPNGT